MRRFTLAPCDLSDAPALARVCLKAMWENQSWVLMWKGKSMEYVISQAERRVPWNLLREGERARHLKAVCGETGEIVGYARWTLPEVNGGENIWTEMKGPSVSAEQAAEAEKEYKAADWKYDRSLDPLDDQIEEAKAMIIQGKQYFVLDQLAVLPEYQRKGVGSILVESGLHIADEHGFDVFIHGKKAGGPLYRKMGFELVGELVLDDAPYGGSGAYAAYFWVRRARSTV